MEVAVGAAFHVAEIAEISCSENDHKDDSVAFGGSYHDYKEDYQAMEPADISGSDLGEELDHDDEENEAKEHTHPHQPSPQQKIVKT